MAGNDQRKYRGGGRGKRKEPGAAPHFPSLEVVGVPNSSTNAANSNSETWNSNVPTFIPTPSLRNPHPNFTNACAVSNKDMELSRIHWNLYVKCPYCKGTFLASDKASPPNINNSINQSSSLMKQYSLHHAANNMPFDCATPETLEQERSVGLINSTSFQGQNLKRRIDFINSFSEEFSTLPPSITSILHRALENPVYFHNILEALSTFERKPLLVARFLGARLDLHRIFVEVTSRGGIRKVTNEGRVPEVLAALPHNIGAQILYAIYSKSLMDVCENYLCDFPNQEHLPPSNPLPGVKGGQPSSANLKRRIDFINSFSEEFSTLPPSITSILQRALENPVYFHNILEALSTFERKPLLVARFLGARLDLHRIFVEVTSRGGIRKVTNEGRVPEVLAALPQNIGAQILYAIYSKSLMDVCENYLCDFPNQEHLPPSNPFSGVIGGQPSQQVQPSSANLKSALANNNQLSTATQAGFNFNWNDHPSSSFSAAHPMPGVIGGQPAQQVQPSSANLNSALANDNQLWTCSQAGFNFNFADHPSCSFTAAHTTPGIIEGQPSQQVQPSSANLNSALTSNNQLSTGSLVGFNFNWDYHPSNSFTTAHLMPGVMGGQPSQQVQPSSANLNSALANDNQLWTGSQAGFNFNFADHPSRSFTTAHPTPGMIGGQPSQEVQSSSADLNSALANDNQLWTGSQAGFNFNLPDHPSSSFSAAGSQPRPSNSIRRNPFQSPAQYPTYNPQIFTSSAVRSPNPSCVPNEGQIQPLRPQREAQVPAFEVSTGIHGSNPGIPALLDSSRNIQPTASSHFGPSAMPNPELGALESSLPFHEDQAAARRQKIEGLKIKRHD